MFHGRVMRFATVGTMTLLALGLPLPGRAQQQRDAAPRTQQGPVFSEVLDVRVVNVEVVVTDREGHRVTGLGPDDLELRVDGEKVPIEYFSEIVDGAVVPSTGGAEVPSGVPALASGDQVATSFLVFLDDYFSLKRDRDVVLDALQQQIDQLGERDRMALVRFDGIRLDLALPWTSDRAELHEALRTLRNAKNRGLERLVELRRQRVSLVQNDELLAFIPDRFDLTLEERSYVTGLNEQIRRAVAATSAAMRTFTAPSGRKVLLLLAGGWPFDPIEYIVNNPARPVLESTIERGEKLLQPLTDTANLLGYTVYPIDVPGVGSELDNGLVGLPAEIQTAVASGSFRLEATLHEAMRFLAKKTGGEALINSARRRPLTDVLADTRSYYWLGFTPARSGDDARHAIEVRALRDRLEVRTRDDYRDFSRQEAVTQTVESALYFGTPASAQPLLVRLGQPQRSGRRTMTVPLEVLIPADGLTFLPATEGVLAQLELRIAVLDEDGSTTDTPVVPLPLELEARPADGAQLRYDTAIKLRRKAHDLVIAIYDIPSGQLFSTEVSVAP